MSTLVSLKYILISIIYSRDTNKDDKFKNIYNEMKKSYVKNCNENVQNSYQIIGQNFIDNMYNRSRVRNQNPQVPLHNNGVIP